MSDDCYEILGVKSSASQADIKTRFRFLSHAFHPDKFGTDDHKREAEEAFKRINSAYQVLSNPSERARYDASRTQSSSQARYSRPNPEPPPRRPEYEYRPPPRPKPEPPPPSPTSTVPLSRRRFWLGIAIVTICSFAVAAAAISVCAYIEYDRLHATEDIFRLVAPTESAYRLESVHWLFDHYEKIFLSDDEVGLGKLPAPKVYDVLAFKLQKFFLLCLGSAVIIWSVCLSSGWLLRGFRRKKRGA